MRADPQAVLHQVLEFIDLGQPVDPGLVALAVESSALENMHALFEKEETTGTEGRKPKKFRAGQGKTNQSLAHLGTGVEDEYRKLFDADDDFTQCARQFGYDG